MEPQFIRFGKTGVNLALVIRWECEEGEEFSGDGITGPPQPTGKHFDRVKVTYSSGREEWFEHADATVLRRWLESHATDIAHEPQATMMGRV